ncbi:MAG: hypothetical protein QXD89_01110 [Candidatus Aenigmatarchaeota archaeon]
MKTISRFLFTAILLLLVLMILAIFFFFGRELIEKIFLIGV